MDSRGAHEVAREFMIERSEIIYWN